MTNRVLPGELELAAARVADERGIDAVTISAVAERLGVRPPSLYGHVADRSALLDRLSLFALAHLADALSSALAGRSGRGALEAFAGVHRDLARSSPGLWSALQRPLDGATAAASEGRRIAALTSAVLGGYRVQEEDLVHAVRLLGATVNGFVSLERSGGFAHSTPTPDASWRRAIDALDVLFTAWPTPRGSSTG